MSQWGIDQNTELLFKLCVYYVCRLLFLVFLFMKQNVYQKSELFTGSAFHWRCTPATGWIL